MFVQVLGFLSPPTAAVAAGHHDCGMSNINPQATVDKMMTEGGISAQTISTLQYAGINIHRWLHGFDSVYDSVRNRRVLLLLLLLLLLLRAFQCQVFSCCALDESVMTCELLRTWQSRP